MADLDSAETTPEEDPDFVPADDGSEKKEAALIYEEQAPNLVPTFVSTDEGARALKDISDQVIRDFDAAWEGSEEYRERRAEMLRMFSNELKQKDFPYEGCANLNVPLMLENLSRLVTRAEGEIFGDWKNVFGVLPINTQDEQIARVLTKHGNWQLRHQITDFRRQMSRSLLSYFMAGDFCVDSYYDVAREKNRHEVLGCDEFVIPYVYTTTEVDYSDCPFSVKVLRRYRHELQKMKGEWHGVEEVIADRKPSWDDEPDQEASMSVAEANGAERPDDDQRAPYKLLEYCGWAELPNQQEDRYIKAVVDKGTRNVLLLQIYEEEDWQDRVRFDREQAELEQYRAQSQAFGQARMQADQMRQQIMDPALDPMMSQQMSMELQQIDQMPQPVAPPWAENPDDPEARPEPMKRVPIHMKTHGVCIEPMVGSLGLGYGAIQASLNTFVNVAGNQYVDAATLANCSSFITAGNVDFEKPFSIAPGTVNKAMNLTQDGLQNAIREIKPSPANEQLVNLIRMVHEWAQSSIQAPDVLSGEAGKSGETYRGIATRVEQATKQLSVFSQRYAYALENVLKNNARLNAIYLPEKELLYINGQDGEGGEQIEISRDMYERDYRVEIRSDMRFTSQQEKVAKADELVQMIATIPPLQANPAFQYMAIRKALEAREAYDLVQTLGPPPMPGPGPLGSTPPPMPPGPPGPGGPPGAPPGPPGPPQQ